MMRLPTDTTPQAPEFCVLIADDDATTRTLLAALVRSMGYTVATARNGVEAWAAFQTTEPQLVIADWLMPQVDGLELCRRIRERVGDRTFVMVVTSRDGAEDLEAVLAAGADDYLAKPVSIDHLRARVVIAERRLALSRARRAAEEEVARMRWLAGIGQTVLTLQHEINNPLAALYGSLEALSERNGLPQSLQPDVSNAMDQAKRIAGVVKILSGLKQPSVVEPIPGVQMLSLAGSL